MPAKKYLNVEDGNAINDQLLQLTALVTQLVESKTDMPHGNLTNGSHVTLSANGQPYATVGLSPQSLTYRTVSAVNGLEVGAGVDVPVNSNMFRKRLNRALSGELTNGGRTFSYKWDEKTSVGTWSELEQYGGRFVFTISRPFVKNGSKHRTISRAQ